MNVARILYPVEVLGPGKRIGIWMCGCKHRCKGCSNPELWQPLPEYEVSIDEVMQLVDKVASKNQVDGFTITGGDPMEQAEDLSLLINRLKEYSCDILIYSGYLLDELKDMNDSSIDMVLSNIAVLIDGEYIEERNNNILLRGSDNQEIHILNDSFRNKYHEYMANEHNKIQNFTTSNGVVSVGIHKKGF